MPPRPTPRVLLLHGEEAFLIAEESRRTLAAWTEPLVSDFGYEALDPSGLTAERLRDALLQAPFLDPHRVIAARGIASRRADALAPALNEVPESTWLLLTVSGKLPASSKLVKAVNGLAAGQARELSPLKGRALTDWGYQRARDLELPPAVSCWPAAARRRSSSSPTTCCRVPPPRPGARSTSCWSGSSRPSWLTGSRGTWRWCWR